MAEKTGITWCDATWNCWQGCHKVSAGCLNCYMYREKKRYGQEPNVVVRSRNKTFYAPLKWKEPKRVFVCSWSDFFIEEADSWRNEAFALMAVARQHTFLILTKRVDRMAEWFRSVTYEEISEAAHKWTGGMPLCINPPWPLPNIWLGVTVENADNLWRVDKLLQIPAAKRFVSYEPALGPVNFWTPTTSGRLQGAPAPFIDWLICAGESGPNARPMDLEWARSARDLCKAAGIAFHMKQLGGWPDKKHRLEDLPEDLRIREFPK